MEKFRTLYNGMMFCRSCEEDEGEDEGEEEDEEKDGEDVLLLLRGWGWGEERFKSRIDLSPAKLTRLP